MDGHEDAPGLLYPVRHYGIEREFTGYWPSGDPYDYIRLLKIAYPEIKAADPQAEVILVALLLVDIFDGHPPEAVVNERLSKKNLVGYSREAMEKILSACDAYDIVDFHSLGDYTEIPPTTAWIKETLASLGCPAKPIWIGDAFSMSGLTGFNNPLAATGYKPCHPATEENVDQVVRLLEAVADSSSPEHDTATQWLYAESAKSLVKKLTVAAGENLAGINIGNLEDWAMKGLPEANTLLVRAAGTAVFLGMIESTISHQQAGTPYNPLDPITRVRVPGEPRPAYHALALFMAQVGAYSEVEPCGNLTENLWCYRFQTPEGNVWVAWYDEEKLTFPGEDPPVQLVTLAVEGTSATIWTTPAESIPALSYAMDIENGAITLPLTDTPVFIRVY